MLRIPYYRVLTLCVLAALALQTGTGQGNQTVNGVALVEKIDPKTGIMTLVTDRGSRVPIAAENAQLIDVNGKNASLSDFKEMQHVLYSWDAAGQNLKDIKLTQTFCKKDGPTICEKQVRKKECHHTCSDGPCACPK